MKLRGLYGTTIDLDNPPTMVYSPNREVCIHKIMDCGKGWYLSCSEVGISGRNLHTEDLREAIKKAKFELGCELKHLNETLDGFINYEIEEVSEE